MFQVIPDKCRGIRAAVIAGRRHFVSAGNRPKRHSHVGGIPPGYITESSETGYYHLKSRYYNPELCRFINADSVDVLDEDQNNVLENNLFAYCLNNPVNMVDDGKMSNAIRSTAPLGILTTGLLFGWQVSAAIIIAIATIVVVQILVVYAKSKRETGRPELKNKDERDLKKRNKKEQVGKKVR